MTKANLSTCYVAVGDNDEPYYVQWLVGSSDNAKVRALFADRFPALKSDEMLLEGAFTLEAWRGKGIMAAAMSQIAAKAVEHDARWVVTFVINDNIPSLKGCKKAGFEPYLTRQDRWRYFRRRSTFSPLPQSQTAQDATRSA
jgi:GNAT superfamily N-acetyltransferase